MGKLYDLLWGDFINSGPSKTVKTSLYECENQFSFLKPFANTLFLSAKKQKLPTAYFTTIDVRMTNMLYHTCIMVAVATVSQAHSITGNIGHPLLGCVYVHALWQKW